MAARVIVRGNLQQEGQRKQRQCASQWLRQPAHMHIWMHNHLQVPAFPRDPELPARRPILQKSRLQDIVVEELTFCNIDAGQLV